MLSKRPFRHPRLDPVLQRLREPRRFLQALVGPRQVGKTTLAKQARELLDVPVVYSSADGPLLEEPVWIEQQWERARLETRRAGCVVLILDEIQKIQHWSEVVKKLWDQDTFEERDVRVLLLGSSPLLMFRGLDESLAGRFELLHLTHWGFAEMRDAFGWDVETFIYFGGYPGSASLVDDEERWKRYILDALIEPILSRDILLLTRVDKPALLRRLLQLGCEYSGQILSYQKMVGQLTDAGNTTTLAHYLDLLEGAGLLAGLQKITRKSVRQRASSPKLQVLNTALMSAVATRSFAETRSAPQEWGRLTESSVGAHLINGARGTGLEVFYWREGQREVDFVLRHGERIAVFEVKSGARRNAAPGLETFARTWETRRKVLVGTGGVALEEFLTTPVVEWVR